MTFWADQTKTVSELQEVFPGDKQAIEDFFQFLKNPPAKFFAYNRLMTFDKLLRQYFCNERLMAVLSCPLFGNGGLPPSRLSAFIGVRIYQEFLLDGGYYPGNELQSLPDALSAQFRDDGGNMLLTCPAQKIAVKDKRVIGVYLSEEEFVSARYVVSICDAHQTFFNLLEEKYLNKDVFDSLHQKIPSLSMLPS